MGGYPIQGLDRRGTWSTLDQVRMGYPLTPRPGTRSTPDQVRMGYPYPPRPGMGYPPDLGQGTPWTWDRVPPGPGTGYPPPPKDLRWCTPETWDEYPPRPGMGYPHSIASTCYEAGGMPLAFTQEDFLVMFIFSPSMFPCSLGWVEARTNLTFGV